MVGSSVESVLCFLYSVVLWIDAKLNNRLGLLEHRESERLITTGQNSISRLLSLKY